MILFSLDSLFDFQKLGSVRPPGITGHIHAWPVLGFDKADPLVSEQLYLPVLSPERKCARGPAVLGYDTETGDAVRLGVHMQRIADDP